MPKKISENTGCNFCDLKTKEIDKLKNKVLQLETQNENLKSGKKQKKEYTEEEKHTVMRPFNTTTNSTTNPTTTNPTTTPLLPFTNPNS